MILGDVPPLTAAIESGFNAAGIRFHRIGLAGMESNSGRGSSTFNSVGQPTNDNLESLLRQLVGLDSSPRIGGVVNLMPLMRQFREENRTTEFAVTLFKFLQHLEKDLRSSAKIGGGWLINFTGMDGRFGIRDLNHANRQTAHSVGLFKSLAREWPEVQCGT